MKKIVLLLLLLTALFAKTTTTVDLSQAPYTEGEKENAYGDKIMYQDITIDTQNFTVQNFWKRFGEDGKKEAKHTNIATAAKVKLTIQNSFTCKDGGLPEEGCSGQKPFLLNSGTLNNPDLQKDANGNLLPSGEYRIPFDSAQNYSPLHNDAFYALDAYRDMEYYQNDNTNDYSEEKPKTFFGYMLKLIKIYFSPQDDTTVLTAMTQNEVEARTRYMANIVFGLQQEYRIKRESSVDTNSINQAAITKQPSLLDYNQLMINNTTGCDGIFFSFNPNTITCKFQNFFGMSQWMPFFGDGASLLGKNSNKTSILSDSVLEDTETTLLTLASKLDETNYIQPKIDPQTGRISLIGEIFKPMTFMMGSMFRFFFGENSKNLTEVVSVNFNFTHHMPLTFIEVQNGIVQGFEQFKLLGIESVYGTEVESCRVKQSGFFFTWDKKTFTKGIDTNTKFDMEAGPFGSLFNNSNEYSELNVTTERHRRIGDWGRHDIVNLSTDDWLDWCKRNQGRQKKGIFGRFVDTVSSFILGNNRNETYDAQIDNLLKDDHWSVVEYKEKVHKGLILHLKAIDIDAITPNTAGTTTEFKIMHIRSGHKERGDTK